MDHLVLAALAALAVLAWPVRPHRPSRPDQPSGGSRYRHGVREPGRAATTYAVADALVLLSLALRSGMGQREALEHVAAASRGQVARPETRTDSQVIDVSELQPGIGWLVPEDQSVAAIASIKLAIQHAPGQQVELTNNGVAVNALNYDGVTVNDARSVAWTGGLGTRRRMIFVMIASVPSDPTRRCVRS